MGSRLGGVLRQGRETREARRRVEAELVAIQGAVAHALRGNDAQLLARLPGTPEWDRHEEILARGRRTRTLNLGPAYDSYRALREAARQASESAGPGGEIPPAQARRLLTAAGATRNVLHDAIARAAPLTAQAGMRGVEPR